MSFASFESYEQFLYSLSAIHATLLTSTVTLVRHGKSVAVVQGTIHFEQEIRLQVREQLLALPLVEITDYGYSVWQGTELLYWYDSQPHPHIPELASNHPHHKHVPPDIKHNRIPAPELHFTRPNLSFLIAEIEQTLLGKK